MEKLEITLIAKDATTEARWREQLVDVQRVIPPFKAEVRGRGEGDAGAWVWVDSGLKNLSDVLRSIDRSGRAVFLVVDGHSSSVALALKLLEEGWIDDVIVEPLRALEVLGKFRTFEQVLQWDEVTELNESFTQLVSHLGEDLQLAARIQKGRMPTRFPQVKGFKIESRYLAGMRSGGDYFDMAESKGGREFSFLLTDSTSYGLSSAVLSVIMKVAVKLSAQERISSRETVGRIYEELVTTLGPKDALSLFYGVISRQDLKFRFLNLGSTRAFIREKNGGVTALEGQGGALNVGFGSVLPEETEIALRPEDRVILLSDGFVEGVGGHGPLMKVLESKREAEPKDLLNELVFQVKSRLKDGEDFPPQDCTVIVLDVESNILRVISR